MKRFFLLLIIPAVCNMANAQKVSKADAPVPCNGNADLLPGKYTDHTNPKYPSSLKGASLEKAAMLKQLIAIEKVEEKSRSDFELKGCVARVSFSGGSKYNCGSRSVNRYGYQLGIYQNVCHVTEHIVKTVGEYRTVLRVDVNPSFAGGSFHGEYGDFYVTSKTVRYEIAIDAKTGPGYDKDRISNRSRIAQFISEEMVLTGRSDNHADKQGDFLKLINGESYVENWVIGYRYDKPSPKSYRLISRHYLITKPGIPLLVPVTRKEYLEALLEYYEIEKNNFAIAVADKMGSSTRDLSIIKADQIAYEKIYQTKKEKVKQLLASKNEAWLQKQAVARKHLKRDDYTVASNGLLDFDNFDDSDEKSERLYQYNPRYFATDKSPSTKAMFMEIQFRYEVGGDYGFSERLFANFLRHYDMEALKKMLE
ncbi:hypothetical protein [Pseudobacter ginsenosidimutans]|uniref:Uncharacterized protein n=1 Tax=Pseudobacter ginsenosidimutans TaxID=661488 RepID=A0A4Q7N219_9BACT|nr:hypothetical protein [Pseudobacter ginsenosidimutans]QEC44053.1 hypothetical protein FSB84_21100 [Pseudobacter ginsenosidimutans]RZS75493.1 hypothetical protein EV199_1361 [Pseudobacter ginsenosidimutans]